jgi:hypothetical protein
MGLFSGKGYPKEILELSWQDWSPETAELVRQHFLGPLSQNPSWKDMTVDEIARNIWQLRDLTEEEWYLVNQALSYSAYWDRLRSQENSSTAKDETKEPDNDKPQETT